MDNYSTDDCKKILNSWIVDNGHNSSGKWKLLNKSKNEQGQWVRIFEYSVDSLIMNVIETDIGLVVLPSAIN